MWKEELGDAVGECSVRADMRRSCPCAGYGSSGQCIPKRAVEHPSPSC